LEASHKFKLRAETLRELAGVVALDLEAATPIGTRGAEGRYDEVPPNPQSRSHGIEVRPSIDLLGQEVKHGPVVPHVDLLRQAQVARVSGVPRHPIATISQAHPSNTQGGFGNVHYSHIAVALIQEPVDKKRRSSSDIDDLAVLGRRNCAD
jgi:hypothetical protein